MIQFIKLIVMRLEKSQETWEIRQLYQTYLEVSRCGYVISLIAEQI